MCSFLPKKYFVEFPSLKVLTNLDDDHVFVIRKLGGFAQKNKKRKKKKIQWLIISCSQLIQPNNVL